MRFWQLTTTAVGAICCAALPLQAKPAAQIYECHFPKAGVVVIDTREPGTSITVNGRKHPASEGSYFYGTDDGKIVVMFTSDRKRWGYSATNEDSSSCTRRISRR